MKKSYFIRIFKTEKVILKDRIIIRLAKKNDDVPLSNEESIGYVDGPLKVPDQILDSIAKQLIRENRAEETTLLQWKIREIEKQLSKEVGLTHEQFEIKYKEEVLKVMNDEKIMKESLPILKKEIKNGKYTSIHTEEQALELKEKTIREIIKKKLLE